MGRTQTSVYNKVVTLKLNAKENECWAVGKITGGLWVFRGTLREMTDVNAPSAERTLLRDKWEITRSQGSWWLFVIYLAWLRQETEVDQGDEKLCRGLVSWWKTLSHWDAKSRRETVGKTQVFKADSIDWVVWLQEVLALWPGACFLTSLWFGLLPHKMKIIDLIYWIVVKVKWVDTRTLLRKKLQACVLSHAWLFDSLSGSSVQGIFLAKYWTGLPFPSPGDLPNPGIEPVSHALAGGFFTTTPPQKPK